MPVRRLKGGRYVVELQQAGTRIFRRLYPGASEADAKALEAKIRRDLFVSGQLGIKTEVPIAAAIQAWLNNVAVHQKDEHRARLRSKAWAKFIDGKMLRQAPEVAQAAVQAWNIGDGPSLTSATINRRLALLKATCKWAYQQGMIEENMSGRIRMLREGPGREVYLTLAQVRNLAKAAPSRAATVAILIASYTGLRASELLALTRETSRGDSLLVQQSKTGRPRSVPVPVQVRRLVRELPLGLSYWQLHSDFSAARKKAGMPHVRFHDLRHTCASWLINRDVDLYTVGKILGHSTPLTTARYAHLSHQSLRKAMARLR